MDEHPDLTESELAALSRGKLPPGPRGLWIAIHLRAECSICRERWGNRLAPVLNPAWAGDEAPTSSDYMNTRFDFAVRSALKKVQKRQPEIVAALAQAAREVEGTATLHDGWLPRSTPVLQWARAQAWLAKARSSRREAPEEYQVLASLAGAYALRLAAADHPSGDVADLQALALAEVANSHRRAKRFPQAEALFVQATEKAREGSQLQPVALAIASQYASLLMDQRELNAAVNLLRRTFRAYETLGLRHEAGEQAMLLGCALFSKSRSELALEAFLQALERLDGARDPQLAVALITNVLLAYLDLEQWQAAQRLFPQATEMHRRFGTALDRLKLNWMGAKLLTGEGRLVEAGRAYEDVIAEFERQGQYAESAVVRLELAGLYLTRRRFDRAQVVLEDVREVFESIGIHREAFAALVLLKQAVAGECATLEMVQKVVAAMEVGAKGR